MTLAEVVSVSALALVGEHDGAVLKVHFPVVVVQKVVLLSGTGIDLRLVSYRRQRREQHSALYNRPFRKHLMDF